MLESVYRITADKVKKSIDNKEDFILLDVRTAGEYGKGKIEGSINVSLDDFLNKITEVIPDKKKKVYVYCLSGSRSDMAVEKMIKSGYVSVFSMESGLLAWRYKKYPLIFD